MSIDINPADTGEIPRIVGEDTRVLDLHDVPAMSRRPSAEPPVRLPERSFALVAGSTGELPIIGAGLASFELPPFVTPAVQEPGYWERLWYTGRRRAPGRIARLLGKS